MTYHSPRPTGPPTTTCTARPRRRPVRRRPPRRRRTGLAAAVVATSLVVGGGAGLGGAALWDATHEEPTTSQQSAAASTTTVADQGDVPAVAGSVESVAQAVLPTVVKIDVTGDQGSGSGSGIILTSDGTILTNNHVVDMAAGGAASLSVSFADGTTADAEILGTDPLTDTAVIKADRRLRPPGRHHRQVGQPRCGRGRRRDRLPLRPRRHRDQRHRQRAGPSGQRRLRRRRQQHDLPRHPDRRGDQPRQLRRSARRHDRRRGRHQLLHPHRRLQTSPAQSGSIGLGFAIPIDEVMPIVDQMAAGETPTHARLGIRISRRRRPGPRSRRSPTARPPRTPASPPVT